MTYAQSHAALHRALTAGALLACLGIVGCTDLPYLLQLAEGQAASQSRTEPVEQVLASGRLTETEQAKLQLIVDARQYAADRMGLNAGNSYTTFDDTSGSPLAWNLSAARQDALVAKTWTFPVVGEVPYLSFFDRAYLDRVEQDLKATGYDTLTYELDTYSTLGLLENPVRSTMLRRGDLSLIDTVIHELLHNTVYRPNESTFNESLATFVGRQGAIDYLRETQGEESGWPQFARDVYADGEKINTFLIQLYSDLAAYYAQPLTPEQKIAGREAVFQSARDRFVAEVQPTLVYDASYSFYGRFPTSNAWVLANRRYNSDLTVFADVYAKLNGDWPRIIDVFRAAGTAAGDPYEYLRTWLASQ